MALITCPDCKKEISSKAESCPNCGYPINSEPSKNRINTPPPPITVKQKEGCFMQTLNAGCMIIGGIIVVIIILTILTIWGLNDSS